MLEGALNPLLATRVIIRLYKPTKVHTLSLFSPNLPHVCLFLKQAISQESRGQILQEITPTSHRKFCAIRHGIATCEEWMNCFHPPAFVMSRYRWRCQRHYHQAIDTCHKESPLATDPRFDKQQKTSTKVNNSSADPRFHRSQSTINNSKDVHSQRLGVNYL
ncbi:unnamed protein product [Rhizophagus irregularis]|nr:unnamed protein product [Rhizophagus irregularis]CAB4418070.1 unnamed protein product [Rhizophagus irregularis]